VEKDVFARVGSYESGVGSFIRDVVYKNAAAGELI
jgi:hypothetical protein